MGLREPGRLAVRAGLLLMASAAVVAVLVLVLAAANGGNDVSKGIATLAGSGVSNVRSAIAWGAAWTMAGGLLAALASRRLVAVFSGAGFLSRPIAGNAFLGAVAGGALAWVILSSRTGLPVSTTHAIAGGLAGAGIAAQGAAALHWSVLLRSIALPLALSPVAAVALLYGVFPFLRRALGRLDRYCVCLERRVSIGPNGASAFSVSGSPVVAEIEACGSAPSIAGRVAVLDALHWISAALTSLARGLNDTPKILALGLAAGALLGVGGAAFDSAVALAMGAGSVIAGRRVTETLARRVTDMDPREGFSANLVTALLVGAASAAALPVSTTHVAAGAVVGVGLHRGGRGVRWGTVRDMAVAWLVTLPVSGLVSAVVYRALVSR